MAPTGLSGEVDSLNSELSKEGGKTLSALVRTADLVGDLLKMDFAECEVLVHDHARQKVQGLPLGCFLLATRVVPETAPDPLEEESCVLLLRVTGQTRLPNASDTELSRFMAGQRVADHVDLWDAEERTDQFTLHQLRYSGVLCRLLGTFRVRPQSSGAWGLSFGADVSNFYAGRGMKVYKPVGKTLDTIVNFSRPPADDHHPLAGKRVAVGRIRYASSEVSVDAERDNVTVNLDPTDLIARRTALFGMSRTGKSNTTKVIAGSVFGLRADSNDEGRIGQLIFDVNGEYANENTQDGTVQNEACLKNVAQRTVNSRAGDVVTYGLSAHPHDPGRKIVKVNFFGGEPTSWDDPEAVRTALEALLVGKAQIDALIAVDSSKYMANFRNTSLEPPSAPDHSANVRYKRSLLIYRSALAAAGFTAPNSLSRARPRGLFNGDLASAMNQSADVNIKRAGSLLAAETCSWDEAVEIAVALRKFMSDPQGGYNAFNASYAQTHDGRSWHDEQLQGVLAIFEYPNGTRSLRALQQEHDPNSVGDYARKIAENLSEGRLVIFDQSVGDPVLNKAAAERIMWAIFNRQKAQFVAPRRGPDGQLVPPSDVLIFAEEAHNLLPASSAGDTANIWSRVAKEGSKYRIGLVYATQEPSSIQSNIMKNTDNWFVAHLNNSDETKELRKYYDFSDFVPSILQVADPGFLRMRTLSNPYIVPVQINKFRVTG